MNSPDPLPVELLVSEHARRCLSTDERGVDAIDQAAADPIHDHRPQTAPKRKVRSVIAILDQLDRETSNRRFTI